MAVSGGIPNHNHPLAYFLSFISSHNILSSLPSPLPLPSVPLFSLLYLEYIASACLFLHPCVSFTWVKIFHRLASHFADIFKKYHYAVFIARYDTPILAYDHIELCLYCTDKTLQRKLTVCQPLVTVLGRFACT